MTTENVNGQGTSQIPAGGEPQGTQEPDFVLSEETLHKLPSETRAIAGALLRTQRELAELRAKTAEDQGYEPDGDDDASAQTQAIEARQAKVHQLLDSLIPDEGHEAIAPGIKKVVAALIQESEELKARLEAQEQRYATQRQVDTWESWKDGKADWEKYDDAMLAHFKAMGTHPSSKRQLDAVYNLIKGAARASILEREVHTNRNAGAAPRLGNTPPSLVSRLKNGGTPVKYRNMNELFEKSFVRAPRVED